MKLPSGKKGHLLEYLGPEMHPEGRGATERVTACIIKTTDGVVPISCHFQTENIGPRNSTHSQNFKDTNVKASTAVLHFFAF